jgi:hypothetical protein
VNEVKAIGGDGIGTPSTRNADQTYVAKWWQSNPMVSWNDVARQLIARNDLDVSDAARLLAMENLAAADAAINTWNDKYHFSFWRRFRRSAGRQTTATPRLRRPDVDATHQRALPRSHVGTPRARRFAHHRAADVLRRRPAGGYQITSAFVNPGGPATRTFSRLLASGR